MSVGFTGTRAGMTAAQKKTLEQYLDMFWREHGPMFRHGKAKGSDLEAAAIAVACGYWEDPFPAGDDPLGRNRVIVDGASIMFATPHQHEEVLRAGTWAAIRYANKIRRPGITIWPDGNSTPMIVMNHLPMRAWL
jgi:hypothetical protein